MRPYKLLAGLHKMAVGDMFNAPLYTTRWPLASTHIYGCDDIRFMRLPHPQCTGEIAECGE